MHLPPTALHFSRTVTRQPASISTWAAAIPAMPAPAMSTWGTSFERPAIAPPLSVGGGVGHRVRRSQAHLAPLEALAPQRAQGSPADLDGARPAPLTDLARRQRDLRRPKRPSLRPERKKPAAA